MINELINGPKLEGAAAVACSALLGVLVVIIFCFSAALWCFGTVLYQDYCERHNGNRQESNRKPEQSPCQSNNPASLPIHIIGDKNEQLSHRRKSISRISTARSFHLSYKFRRFLSRFISHK
jgi:hypothetical protein